MYTFCNSPEDSFLSLILNMQPKNCSRMPRGKIRYKYLCLQYIYRLQLFCFYYKIVHNAQKNFLETDNCLFHKKFTESVHFVTVSFYADYM